LSTLGIALDGLLTTSWWFYLYYCWLFTSLWFSSWNAALGSPL